MFFSKKLPVELLYDYSIAGDGYFREIHRDSDSRMIVFLLYLSSLPNETKGGSLDIFKLKENAKETLARPDPSMCEKIESITPKPGRLVVFKNDNNSYHSVEKLSDSKSSRYFIYGGFTLLSQNNPFITKGKLKTEFNFLVKGYVLPEFSNNSLEMKKSLTTSKVIFGFSIISFGFGLMTFKT